MSNLFDLLSFRQDIPNPERIRSSQARDEGVKHVEKPPKVRSREEPERTRQHGRSLSSENSQLTNPENEEQVEDRSIQDKIIETETWRQFTIPKKKVVKQGKSHFRAM